MNAAFWVKVKAKKSYRQWIKSSVSVTANKPSTASNEVAIKLNLVLPDTLFEQPQLVANITIPENDTAKPEISADVQDNIAELLSEHLGINVSVTMPEAE